MLTAETSTGIVNVAPWHELSEAFDIATAFATVTVAVPFAATAAASPVCAVTETPVEASHAAPLFEVTTPPLCNATDVILTGNGFEFVTFNVNEPVAPG